MHSSIKDGIWYAAYWKICMFVFDKIILPGVHTQAYDTTTTT